MAITDDPAKGPLYWQLAERLRAQIAAGEYAEGEQLPTEEALGRIFGVSRITVRGALERLTAEGLLRRERGRGTFVAVPPVEHSLSGLTDFAEDMAAAGLNPSSVVTHFAEEPATERIAAELGLPSGTPVTRLDRRRLADGQTIAFDHTYLPTRVGRLLDRDALPTETIYHQLATRYEIPALRGRYTIEALPADDLIAEHLGIAAGGTGVTVATDLAEHRGDDHLLSAALLPGRPGPLSARITAFRAGTKLLPGRVRATIYPARALGSRHNRRRAGVRI